MPFDASVRAYLRAYQNEYRAALHGGQHTAELSFRVPMHEMFRRIAHDLNPAGTFDIILEPRNQGRMGRPDWRMVEAEKRMFAELVRDKRLGQDAYLPKDGSLEYKIMKSGREDLRTLQKIKHNYSWVIGVSKSFNPESCLDHTGKPNSNYIADLPVFQRFIIKPFYECLV